MNKTVINNIQKSFKEFDLVKGGKKTGVYANTAKNRKDGKVGQKYSKDKEEVKTDKTTKSPDTYSFNEVSKKFPSSKYNVGIKEIDSFNSDFSTGTKNFIVINEKTGEKTSSGRDIFKDEQIYFQKQKDGKFKSVDDPYRKKITAENIKIDSKFKIKSGDIFIIEAIKKDPELGTIVTSHLEGGTKGNYKNEINDMLSFFEEEKAKKV